jgi:hypothetical protein
MAQIYVLAFSLFLVLGPVLLASRVDLDGQDHD